MPAHILHNATNQSHIDSNAAPRSPLRRKLGPSSASKHALHSPDGYFAHEEAIVRAWRPLAAPDPASLRNRSKTHIGHVHVDTTLQDVVEEEDASNPHAWRKPSRTDSRSPCPALNTLSNHAYLPRDGRDISLWALVRALQEGYGASWVLAFALTFVSFVILRLGGVGKGWLRPTIDLEDLTAHAILEHNGSLTRPDAYEEYSTHELPRSRSSSTSSTAVSTTTPPAPPALIFHFPFSLLTRLPFSSQLSRLPFSTLLARLPPFSLIFPQPTHTRGYIHASPTLVHALLADSASGTHLTLADVARARVRREATSRPNSRILSQFADGEFAMSLDFLGDGDGRVEIRLLRDWLLEERLPRGWKPNHVQGLWRTHVATEKVRSLMRGLRKYQQRAREGDVRSVAYE